MTDELPDFAAAARAFAESTARAFEALDRTSKRMAETMPFVVARLSDALATIGEANRKIKPLLRHAVYAAADNGMPETRIAELAGLDRSTVRDWLGKQFKRGDLVQGTPWHSSDATTYDPPVVGRFVPRDDHPGARPPFDAAWIDDGSRDGPLMVRRETVRPVKEG